MSATQNSIKLLEILDQLNKKIASIIIKEHAQYLDTTYLDFSNIYRELVELLGKQPSLLLIQLTAETTRKQYAVIEKPLKNELKSYYCWYSSQADLIDSLFSTEIIYSVIDSLVDYKYGKQHKEAQEEFLEIYEDEKVWHELTRAYGSRITTHSESSFTQEDWDYIQDSLDAFKKHFKVEKVQLAQVYERYSTEIKPKWLKCYHKRNEISELCQKYRQELRGKYVSDVFQKIYVYLLPLYTKLETKNPKIKICNNQYEGNSSAESKEESRACTSLRDCIQSEEVYNAVIELVNDYYKTNNHIDGNFGILLLIVLKDKNYLQQDITETAFGDLIKKEFGVKVSYENGGALNDAKLKLQKTALIFHNRQNQLSQKLESYIARG